MQRAAQPDGMFQSARMPLTRTLCLEVRCFMKTARVLLFVMEVLAVEMENAIVLLIIIILDPTNDCLMMQFRALPLQFHSDFSS